MGQFILKEADILAHYQHTKTKYAGRLKVYSLEGFE